MWGVGIYKGSLTTGMTGSSPMPVASRFRWPYSNGCSVISQGNLLILTFQALNT
jgi:hypothetical protein